MHQFKQISPTDHFGWHAAYLEVYEKLFSPIRGIVMDVLEIGTDGGGGLLMYADYFRVATIHGIDISPTPDGVKKNPRIRHSVLDAYTNNTFEKMAYQTFGVIIDDGPHSIESQEFFASHYPRILTKNGIAIIEDIQDRDHIARLANVLPPDFFGIGIDIRHENARYDNLIMAIWRR